MIPTRNDDQPRNLERTAFGALCAFLLAPVIAQGVWRPLIHFLGPSGDSAAITAASLVVCGAVLVSAKLVQRHGLLLSLAAGGVVSLLTTLGFSLGLPGLVTLLIVATAMGFLMPWLSARLPGTLDGLARRHKVLFALYALLALAAVVKTAQLSIFMGDATRVEHQVMPSEKFIETHSCLTAYVHADTLSRQRVDNLYEEHHWLGSQGLPPAPAGVENPYRPFLLDYFAYPPPFLLAMTPIAVFSGDFAAQRALWFALNALLSAVGLWTLARWLDGPGAHKVLLLAPIFFGSLSVLITFQIGNFQCAVVMISVLAMVAFDRDRPALGGALLAFAIMSKISPALLGIVLLVQRRFRYAAWTAAFGVLFLALSLVTIGPNPMVSFLTYTLSRLSSGVVFTFMDDTPFNILTNMGPFGLAFKFQLAGLDVGDPWVLGRRIARVYSVLLVVLAIIGARRTEDRRTQAMIWMSLLVLAALQSPFAPGYVVIGFLWAITIWATRVQSVRGGVSLVVLWIFITLIPPIPNLQLFAVFGLLQSAVLLGVPIWLITKGASGAGISRSATTR